MPRLGTEIHGHDDDLNERQRPAIAYPSGHGGPLRILIGVGVIMILRNLLFHDYRSDLVSQLESLGQTPEQIEQYLPKTVKERSQRKETEATRLRDDVDYLLTAVNELQLKAGLPTRNETVATNPLHDA